MSYVSSFQLLFMDPNRLSKQMDFITEIDKLKQVVRESWLVDASRKETDAEHSWHIAVMVLLLSEYANDPNIDIVKVLKMLLIHDIVEIDAGDTFIYDQDQAQDQNDREIKAATRLFALLPPDQEKEFHQLWQEYEAMTTSEAKFARAIDSMQPLLLAYLNEGCSWRIHNISKSEVISLKKHIPEGSKALWTHTLELLNQAVEKGFLKE
ncbi:MAG: HD domain-containing protein [Candidatus Hermodarchaeia archaeon]